MIIFFAARYTICRLNLAREQKSPATFGIYKPVYNAHPRDPKIVAVVDMWSLFRGTFMLETRKVGPQNSGHCKQVVVSSGLTVRKIEYRICQNPPV